jgi:acyl-coenzyme A thioesterase PaaI-like protein
MLRIIDAVRRRIQRETKGALSIMVPSAKRILQWEGNVCYVCRQNPGISEGFPISYWGDAEGVQACWIAPSWSVNQQGFVHPGVIASIVDDAMGHAIYHSNKVACMTADITIHHHGAVFPDHPLQIQGWVEVPDRRIIHAFARIVTASGTTAVSASGKFIPAPDPMQPPAPSLYF